MNGKKWLKIFFSILFLLLTFRIIVNFIIDPFNIFHTKILKTEFQQNERFIKVEMLEKDKTKFNGYMFGSSRIGTTKASTLEKYFPDSKFYNFTISSGNLYDYEKHLEYFLKKGYKFKNLYIQIDLDNMNSHGRHPKDYLRKFHPNLLNQELYSYYMEYLEGRFYANIKGKIKKNINDTNPMAYDWSTGVWTKPLKDEQIKNDCIEFVKNEPTFNTLNKRKVKYTKREKNLRSLKKITRLCKINNINLIIFITPHNKNMMDTFVIKDYIDFLIDIASITDYYNFSGYNTVTLNNCNYYEYSHYHYKVGDLIAARIFNDKSIDVPDDFGFYVTRKSIKKHIKYMKKNLLEYDSLK